MDELFNFGLQAPVLELDAAKFVGAHDTLGQYFGHHTASPVRFDTHPGVLVTSLHGLDEVGAPVLCQGASARHFGNEGRWVVITGSHRIRHDINKVLGA